MKTQALLAAVVAATCGCATTTSDRPRTNDEPQAAIEERDERQAAMAADREESDLERLEADEQAPRERVANDDADAAKRSTKTNEAAEREPDNTGRNERDDEPGNLTALDQSNSESDVDITQAIRKKVVADDALSFNAKNVKIITVSGKVTLRGPVASAQESASIEKSARTVPGVVQVDNQIEVKR